jgi:Flp pilus assembly protein TadD
MGYVLLYRRQYEQARQHIERALALNPHHPDIVMVLGMTELWSGNPETGLAKVKEAMRPRQAAHGHCMARRELRAAGARRAGPIGR